MLYVFSKSLLTYTASLTSFSTSFFDLISWIPSSATQPRWLGAQDTPSFLRLKQRPLRKSYYLKNEKDEVKDAPKKSK